MFPGFDPASVPSPSYVVSLDLLEKNARLLASIRERTGAKVLLALKGFAMFSTFPLLRNYLDGTCASGMHEALLGAEEFRKEVHTYSPAYTETELREVLPVSHHVAFNSITQWQRFRELALAHPNIRCGLRVNPENSHAPNPLYDPCAPGSRLGIRAETLAGADLEGISGFTFHALCQQDSRALASTLDSLEEKFGPYLETLDWLNFGGGHHITRPDYDVDHLCELIVRIRDRYGLQIYLEPGEAVGLNTGILVATVLDIVENDGRIAILDTSATTHMPDVLEMPYTPDIVGASIGEHPDGHVYRLGCPSCLSGDFIGTYTFPHALQVGQRLMFTDMAHYTMVKNTTFNGIPLPAIVTYAEADGAPKVIREFGYDDYKMRLS
jgi:carboxynorspermidine decarboxylase